MLQVDLVGSAFDLSAQYLFAGWSIELDGDSVCRSTLADALTGAIADAGTDTGTNRDAHADTAD